MKKPNLIYFNLYYVLVLIFGLINVYYSYSNPVISKDVYFGDSLSFVNYLILGLGLIIFLASIYLIIIVIKTKLPKIHLIFPIFYIIYIIIYSTLIPGLIGFYMNSLESTLDILDKLSIGDKITYFLSIIFPAYMLYWLNKK